MRTEAKAITAEDLFRQWLDARVLGQPTLTPEHLCKHAPLLIPELNRLIADFHAIDEMLPSPSKPATDVDDAPVAPIIDRYQVHDLLGRGGMGEVWDAEQIHPIRRPLALKVIKSGRDTASVLRRFNAERQAMAAMDHPAIAKLFDAGRTENGLPYFAMEKIEGASLVEFCDQHRLSIRRRLELFVQICEGVQHAHHKGIIHRDLKPSNLLVAEVDGEPQPKIIDFGIAKAILTDPSDGTLTEQGQVVGTPAYMSPEQLGSMCSDVDARSCDIDTRTDVYSLGVVLYELLVGVRPAQTRSGQNTGDEPPTPSSQLSTLGSLGPAVAKNRGTRSTSLIKMLKGDLDWITLKALRIDREQRYDSPVALVEDLRRYFRDEPVLARPQAAIYFLTKFVRRHRWGVATALVMMLAALSAVAGLVIGLDRARRAEHRAKQESQIAGRVSGFLEELFRQSNPKAEGEPLTVRELLDRGAERIDSELADEPELQARLLETMGHAYSGIGSFEVAESLVSRTIQLRRQQGDSPLELARALYELADLHRLQGRYSEAFDAARQALDLRRQAAAPSLDLIKSHRQIGTLYAEQGQFQASLKALEQAISVAEQTLGPNHLELGKLVNNTAVAHLEVSNFDRARELMEQGLRIFERTLGPEHPHVAANLNNLALVAQRSGDLVSCEDYHRRALSVRESTLGPDHPDVAETLNNLGVVLTDLSRHEEAGAFLDRALAIRQQSLAPHHPLTGTTWFNLGRLAFQRGDLAQARTGLERGRDMIEKALGPEHLYLATVLDNLAQVDAKEGKNADAEDKWRQCMGIVEKNLGADHPQMVDCLEPYQDFLTALGRTEEARLTTEAIQRIGRPA